VLLRRDADYIVTGGEVVLVDPVTGRRRPDSRYQHGLHAAIEAKEGLPFRPEPEVQAQISVQGYIGLYSHVAGMTGTALAAADEFRRFYGLSVEAVPPTNRSVRTDHATRVFDNQSEKLAALVDDVVHWHRMGRPVLVGTAAVEQSEEISALLRDHEIEHTVLNAVTCSAEADIVKAAGNFGAVTVATNMAGRGTDILLEPGLDERITDGCVEMVRAALAGGAAQVALQCSTPGEVSIAERALSAAGVRTHGGDQLHDVVATSGRTASMPGSPVVFEFGLGLHVMGTELNESRRIDDQLRGRVGRQGAFGSTRFLVAQDDRSVFAQPGDRPSYRGERRTGSNGVPYLEGQRTQRAVDSLQQLGERDSELDRVAAWEFNKIVERQTLAYYALRRVFLGSESIRDAVSRFAKAAARRLIDCHLPESAISSYEARFGRLAEELQLDYQIDLSSSFGLGLESLRSAVGELIIARVRRVESECRHTDFAAFARLLMVQTADEQWPVHLSRLHDMMLSAHLSGYPVDRTVAEYALAATNEYDGFIRAASDSFLVKLAAYREAAAGPEPELAHELQEILA
jgi:preprotein translocase subunit SecA